MIWTSSCFIEVFFFLNKTQSRRFFKIPFSCRISVDARASLGNKDASSNSLGVVSKCVSATINYYLTIRLRARVFYEQIVNEGE